MVSGSAVQTNGLGSRLCSSTKRLIASCSATSEWNVPRRRRLFLSLAKKVSTALSHEHEVGVKWKVQRGWRPSQASTLGWLGGPGGVAPGRGRGLVVRVGAVVVEDRVHQLAGGHGRLDGVEETDELLVAVP